MCDSWTQGAKTKGAGPMGPQANKNTGPNETGPGRGAQVDVGTAQASQGRNQSAGPTVCYAGPRGSMDIRAEEGLGIEDIAQ